MNSRPAGWAYYVIVGLILTDSALLLYGLIELADQRAKVIVPPPSQTRWRCAKPKSWPAFMPADRVHSGPALRILCIGDSITFGNGNKTIAFGGYREPLRRLLLRPVIFVGRQHCGYPLIAPNEGYPGWSAGDIAAIAKQGAAISHPNVVLYMAGVNDFNPYHTDTVDEAAKEEELCIRNIAAGAPAARIYVATLTPLRPNSYISPESARELSNRIPGIVQNLHSQGINCTLVDMAAKLHLLPTEYDYMNVHPSDSGCVKEARVWAAAIQGGK